MNDKGFTPERTYDARDGDCGLYRVWLDDVEVTEECVVAEAGRVTLLEHDSLGNHYPSPWRPGEIASRWHRGAVRIEARD